MSNCKQCDRKFKPRDPSQKYCGVKCRTAAQRKINPAADVTSSEVAMRNKFLQMPVRGAA